MLIVSLLGLMWSRFWVCLWDPSLEDPLRGGDPWAVVVPLIGWGPGWSGGEKDKATGPGICLLLPFWLPPCKVPCSIWSSPPMNCKSGHPVFPFPLDGFFWVCGQVMEKLASTKETHFHSSCGWRWGLILDSHQHPLCHWATLPASSF